MGILKTVITILFVIAALAIIVVVLLQEGKSAGLGSLSGTTNNDSYWEKNKKNSLEGKFEKWTKITAGLFVVFALVLMLLQSKSATVDLSGGTSATTAPTESATPAASEAPAETSTTTENQAADETSTATEGQAADETTADNADTAASTTEASPAAENANQ